MSDILQLSTRRPVADYLPGGTVYQKRLRQKRFLSGAWNTLLVALVLGAAFYVLWLIPGELAPHLSRARQTGFCHGLARRLVAVFEPEHAVIPGQEEACE